MSLGPLFFYHASISLALGRALQPQSPPWVLRDEGECRTVGGTGSGGCHQVMRGSESLPESPWGCSPSSSPCKSGLGAKAGAWSGQDKAALSGSPGGPRSDRCSGKSLGQVDGRSERWPLCRGYWASGDQGCPECPWSAPAWSLGGGGVGGGVQEAGPGLPAPLQSHLIHSLNDSFSKFSRESANPGTCAF